MLFFVLESSKKLFFLYRFPLEDSSLLLEPILHSPNLIIIYL